MSYAKFAPVTAGLLARKGEAAPSRDQKRAVDWTSDVLEVRDIVRDVPSSLAPGPEFTRPTAANTVSRSVQTGEKPRRVVLSLNRCDFERLGIAAVKRGVSRHDLVMETMNDYLSRLSVELNNRCACLREPVSCAELSLDERNRGAGFALP